jgi:hypothetical protein
LGQAAEPPGRPDIGADLAPEAFEVHAASGPDLAPILETTKGMISLDRTTGVIRP